MTVVKGPKLPGGRHRANMAPGQESSAGEAFREDVLIPALAGHSSPEPMVVDLRDCYGVPPSWCEETFGGLVRRLGPTVIDRIRIVGDDDGDATRFMREQMERGLSEEA